MKTARFVAASRELFYFITSVTMLCRYCETLEEAKRMIAASGISQNLVTDGVEGFDTTQLGYSHSMVPGGLLVRS
jgi:hypothetical protein